MQDVPVRSCHLRAWFEVCVVSPWNHPLLLVLRSTSSFFLSIFNFQVQAGSSQLLSCLDLDDVEVSFLVPWGTMSFFSVCGRLLGRQAAWMLARGTCQAVWQSSVMNRTSRILRPIRFCAASGGVENVRIEPSLLGEKLKKQLLELQSEKLLEVLPSLTSVQAYTAGQIIKGRFREFRNADLGHLFQSLGRLATYGQGSVPDDLLDLSLDRGDLSLLEAVNLATILASADGLDISRLRTRIIEIAERRVAELSPEELELTIRHFSVCCGKLEHAPVQYTSFLNSLLAEMARRIPTLPCEAVTSGLHAAAHASLGSEFTGAVEKALKASVSRLDSEHIALLCEGVHNAGSFSESFCRGVFGEVLAHFPDWPPEQLGKGLLLLPNDKSLRKKCTSHLMEMLVSEPLDFKEVCKVVGAGTRKSKALLSLVNDLCSLVELDIGKLSSVSAAVALMLFTQTRSCTPGLTSSLAARVRKSSQRMRSEDLCTTIYCFGQAYTSVHDKTRFDLLEEARLFCSETLDTLQLTPESASYLCSGLLRMKIYQKQWLDTIADYVLLDVDLFCTKHFRSLLGIAKCFAEFGHKVPLFAKELGSLLDGGMHTRLTFDWRMRLLSFLMLNDVFPSTSLAAFFADVASMELEEVDKLNPFSQTTLLQLSVLVLSMRRKGSAEVPSLLQTTRNRLVRNTVQPHQRLSQTVDSFLSDLEEFVGKGVISRRLVSRRGLFAAAGFFLGDDGWPVQWKWIPDATSLTVEELRQCELQPVAVLPHFRPGFAVDSVWPLGYVQMQERSFQACGWLTVVVPMHEWEKADDKRVFLRQTFQNALTAK